MLRKQIELALLHIDSGVLFVGLILSPVIVTIGCGTLLKLHGIVFDLLLGLSFALSILICAVAAKWRLSLVKRVQLETLEKVVNIDIDTANLKSEEERFNKHPRKLKFNTTVAGNPPHVAQVWMLLNPTVWLMCFYLWQACTLDQELKTKGQTYPAKLVRTAVGDRSYQNKGSTFSLFQQTLTFEYVVEEKKYQLAVEDSSEPNKYKEGETHSIRALPNKPEICEPFGKDCGARQGEDLYAAALFLFVNLFLEFSIWYQPLRHRRLAQIGIPVPVRLKQLQNKLTIGSGGSLTAVAPSTFNVYAERLGKANQTKTEIEFKVNAIEYSRLQPGAIELALLDPMFKSNTVFYKFCKYQLTD